MAAREVGTLILACLGVAGCGRGARDAVERPPADTFPTVVVEPTLSDSQALDVLMALSAAGARAADSIPDLIAAPEVRRYLNVVRADHEALQAELKLLADSLRLTPQTNPAGDRLRAAAEEARLQAGTQDNTTAASTVLEQQVKLHTAFLGALDSAVLHGQRQPLLARYARAIRPTISAHLLRAEQLERILREQPARANPIARARPAPVDTPPRPRPAALELGGRRTRPDTSARQSQE